ncbi:MAG: hypothetical protein JSR60_17160 [Proteobacteria bacterium]|nr:hypothetical protein [Pseudomonadota bacterium]
MTDWPTIHYYAEEAELWSTLAINLWALAAGMYLVVGRLVGRSSSGMSQLVHALIFGMACADIGLIAMVSVFQPPHWIWMIAANISASVFVIAGVRISWRNSN